MIAMCGYNGAALAVKTGGSGDVTAKNRVWFLPRVQRERLAGVADVADIATDASGNSSSCTFTVTVTDTGGTTNDLYRSAETAALTVGGFTPDDIKEIILQQANYCGVPAGNHAFREAEAVLTD